MGLQIITPKSKAQPGDWVLFNWNNGGSTWDHIGMVVNAKTGETIEGNSGKTSDLQERVSEHWAHWPYVHMIVRLTK